MGKFVYLYGLIVSTIILMGSMFVPSPYNFIQIILLVPFVAGMWLHLTNPRKVTEATWSIRVVIISTILVLIGVGAFYLSRPKEKPVEVAVTPVPKQSIEPTVSPVPSSSPNISDQIESIEIENTPIPMPVLGSVKVMAQNEVDVYEMKDSTSKVVGIALPAQIFSFFENDSNWYLIDIGGSTGWIKAGDVSEVNQ